MPYTRDTLWVGGRALKLALPVPGGLDCGGDRQSLEQVRADDVSKLISVKL